MDREDARRAFIAIQLAIQDKLVDPTKDVTELAHQYGARISTPTYIDIGMKFFNWPALQQYFDKG
jgi:hypothetical protein